MDSVSVLAQRVRWGPSDGRPAGLRLWDLSGVEAQFLPWSILQSELMTMLLPQLFADPSGFRFEMRDYHGKKDWLVQVFHDSGESYCDVWFGDNPDQGWEFDGLVRVGDADNMPFVWQTYQRYSDGTYRRVSSIVATLDEASRGNGPMGLFKRPPMP